MADITLTPIVLPGDSGYAPTQWIPDSLWTQCEESPDFMYCEFQGGKPFFLLFRNPDGSDHQIVQFFEKNRNNRGNGINRTIGLVAGDQRIYGPFDRPDGFTTVSESRMRWQASVELEVIMFVCPKMGRTAG